MKLILVRHGQSAADIEGKLEGRYDSDLTELGYEQAKLIAEWLKKSYKITKLFTSPLKRALYTANIIADFCHSSIVVNDGLMEWNNGVLAGMLRSEANEKYPMPKEGRKPYENPFGMESLIQFRLRVESFWQELIDKHHNDECICIVSHGGTIRMLFASILGLPIINNISIEVNEGSIHIFDIQGQKRTIDKINLTEHLI